MQVETKCMSVKNIRHSDIQCPYKRKFGDYCGIHHKSKNVIRIDDRSLNNKIMLNITYCKPTKEEIDNYESEYYDNVHYIQTTAVEKIKYPKLIKTLQKYKIQIQGSINYLIDTLIKHINAIDLIEQAYKNTSLCNNTDDFYYFEKLDDIKKEYLFIFQCMDRRLYGMDLRSIYTYFQELKKSAKLLDKPVNYINPYNRCNFTSVTLHNYHQRIKELQEAGLPLKYPEMEVDPESKLNFKVLEVFSMITNYGYIVDSNIFLDMNKEELLSYYGIMDEIWNNHFKLTTSVKKNIVPNNINIFNPTEYYQIKNYDKPHLQEILINKIEEMITTGINREARISGINYILLGLSEICEYVHSAFNHND